MFDFKTQSNDTIKVYGSEIRIDSENKVVRFRYGIKNVE